MPILQRLRLGVLAVIAVIALPAVTSCGSGSASSASSASPDGSQPHYIAFGVDGGEYAWMPPRVTPASRPGGRPKVAAGKGRDPMTGSTTLPIVVGNGAAVTDLSQVRIRYLQQSWDGKHIAHDSWQSPGQAEQVPTERASTEFRWALLNAHVGDLIELVAPANSADAVAGQSVVMVIAVEAS